MDNDSLKADLQRYLQAGRDAVLWKLEGLTDYDVRRPLVRTGTNLLGLAKHLAGVEIGYFGDCFGRPFDQAPPWMDDGAAANVDMWATREESREEVVGLYRRAGAHSDATIAALRLDAPGRVAWWPEDRQAVTLGQILIHMIAETQRHAGHSDVVRELIDGTAGHRRANDNLPPGDAAWWDAYRATVEESARSFWEA